MKKDYSDHGHDRLADIRCVDWLDKSVSLVDDGEVAQSPAPVGGGVEEPVLVPEDLRRLDNNLNINR